MEIFDKLVLVDKELKDALKIRADQKEKEETIRREEEAKKQQKEKETQKELKIKKLQDILEDNEAYLDEPHLYSIEYSHSGGGGYGYGPQLKPGVSHCDIIMTERERKIAELTGYIEKCTDAESLAYGCKCTGVNNISELSRKLSEEEQMKVNAIRKKSSIIKTDEEAKAGCVINFNDAEFGNISIPTSLRNALLTSVSIKNGRIQQPEKSKTELPVKVEKPISLARLKEAIRGFFGRQGR